MAKTLGVVDGEVKAQAAPSPMATANSIARQAGRTYIPLHKGECPMSRPDVPAPPRGYFAIGAERISKSLNLGNLMRSAHGFGASFTFTIGATYQALEARADTSKGAQHLPHFSWASVEEMALPKGCRLVGVELLDEAIDLPSFHHPPRAAYVLGPELGTLSEGLIARCDHVVRVPSSFCINVAMAGAIVMYDRVRSLGRFPPRPVGEGGTVGGQPRGVPRKVGRGKQ
jgi:tRNA G18 (ribose-2'-O)-methylase SpoU